MTNTSCLTKQPDGYQVINTTTHETVHYEDRIILTWQAAQAVKEKYPEDYFQIIAVTEEEVQKNIEGAEEFEQEIEYVPNIFSFSPGTSHRAMTAPDGTKIYHMTGDPDRPNNVDGDIILDPPTTALALNALGLTRARAFEWEQDAWPLEDFRKGFAQANRHPHSDPRVAPALAALARAAEFASEIEADFVLLNYHGFYDWEGRKKS